MIKLGVIGGTGLTSLKTLEITRREMVHTSFGEASGPLTFGRIADCEVVFLARHGYGHTIPPHRVNFRANLWALHQTGVENVIAVAAVGGIHPDMKPGKLAFPDQIIDYTSGRHHTFFDNLADPVTHIDFTHPYCDELRARLIEGARTAGIDACDGGTYGATQGPRLETAAEIDRLERDGCAMVGMTGMPEAALARELGLCYATCAVISNWAAGRRGDHIAMDEIDSHLRSGMRSVCELLEAVIKMV